MKLLQYFFSAAFLLLVTAGCKKDKYDDVSFLQTDPAPAKLSAMFDITQDNSGLVTILPNGESISFYEIYYGDATTDPGKVLPGKKIQHIYPEGVFNVKIVGHSITGKTTEATQQLTVAFRAPENLDFTASIDPSSNFKVNVSATADYETLFKVYFGEDANETPVSFLEGETQSHTYAATGTYTIKVVALSGGVATTELTKTVTIVDPVLLPLTFESPTLNYAFTNFGNATSSVVNNPHIGTGNNSAKVVKQNKAAGAETWAGSFIELSTPINFATMQKIKMKVWSPTAGRVVKLKLENFSNSNINIERDANTTIANGWEELTYDFTGIDNANNYQRVVVFFDFGNTGTGADYYFDDIQLTSDQLVLPLGFESATLTYNFTGFGNASATVVNNPDAAGINTSAKVGSLTKANGAEVWAGAFIELQQPIDFSALSHIKMKVWSPAAGIVVKFKMENLANSNINIERDATTTVANGWEELTYDFSGIDNSNAYQRIVVFFDFGNAGTGATYYFDDIKLN